MNCFTEEICKTVTNIKKCREKGDLCFVMLSDSHLSEQGIDTCNNIRAVDNEIGFDFIVHLGNIINGNNPEKISGDLLEFELDKYKNSIKKHMLFVSRGKTDGWRNERFMGQLAENIVTDSMWYSHTSFIDDYKGVVRHGDKPYYYADCHDKDIRLVFLSSYNYQIDSDLGLYEKYLSIDVEQAGWLMREALNVRPGTTVLLFSNRIPKSRFETGVDPYIYEGCATEQTLAILQQAKKRGADIACWFGGGYGYDSEICVGGINLAVINSQLPRVTEKAECSDVRFSADRKLNTVKQDCWDAVILKRNERAVHILRFGCGNDRVIHYI